MAPDPSLTPWGHLARGGAWGRASLVAPTKQVASTLMHLLSLLLCAEKGGKGHKDVASSCQRNRNQRRVSACLCATWQEDGTPGSWMPLSHTAAGLRASGVSRQGKEVQLGRRTCGKEGAEACHAM